MPGVARAALACSREHTRTAAASGRSCLCRSGAQRLQGGEMRACTPERERTAVTASPPASLATPAPRSPVRTQVLHRLVAGANVILAALVAWPRAGGAVAGRARRSMVLDMWLAGAAPHGCCTTASAAAAAAAARRVRLRAREGGEQSDVDKLSRGRWRRNGGSGLGPAVRAPVAGCAHLPLSPCVLSPRAPAWCVACAGEQRRWCEAGRDRGPAGLWQLALARSRT